MRDCLEMALSSFEGRKTLISLSHHAALLRAVEKQTSTKVNDHAVYKAIFKAIEDQKAATARIEALLKELPYEMGDDEEDCYLYSEEDIQICKEVCKSICHELMRQLQEHGLYKHGSLIVFYVGNLSTHSAVVFEKDRQCPN